MDRSLEVNGPNGPAGNKNVQRYGTGTQYITEDDIIYIPLEEIKVNKVNTFSTEEEYETWHIEETDLSFTSDAVDTVSHGPDLAYMAASITSMVTFYNKRRRKAYKLQYHIKVKEIKDGLDLNLFTGSISDGSGSKKFRKGTPMKDIFLSYTKECYVKEFSLPIPGVSVSVGRFYGSEDKDGHQWYGFYTAAGLGLSIGLYLDLVLYYEIPKGYPPAEDISDTQHANYLFH